MRGSKNPRKASKSQQKHIQISPRTQKTQEKPDKTSKSTYKYRRGRKKPKKSQIKPAKAHTNIAASAAIFVCAFAGFIWLFLGFLRPRRYLYVLLLVLSGFSFLFCVRGDICMCFCWFYLAFLGFFASAAIFVCAFAGFCWLFLGFWNPS